MQIFIIMLTALLSTYKDLKLLMRTQYLWTKNKLVKRFIFQNYIKFVDEIISTGNGITLAEILNMINTNEDIDIKNNEVKIFLEEFFGNSIQFCKSDRQNQSSMVFFSSMNITDVINTLWSLNGVKSASRTIRDKLLNFAFGLQDKNSFFSRTFQYQTMRMMRLTKEKIRSMKIGSLLQNYIL